MNRKRIFGPDERGKLQAFYKGDGAWLIDTNDQGPEDPPSIMLENVKGTFLYHRDAEIIVTMYNMVKRVAKEYNVDPVILARHMSIDPPIKAFHQSVFVNAKAVNPVCEKHDRLPMRYIGQINELNGEITDSWECNQCYSEKGAAWVEEQELRIATHEHLAKYREHLTTMKDEDLHEMFFRKKKEGENEIYLDVMRDVLFGKGVDLSERPRVEGFIQTDI